MSQDGNPVGSTGATTSSAPGGPLLYELIRRGKSFSGRERNCCFLNTGTQRFADISAASGWGLPDDGRAISQVDWDLDGDLDFWIANRNGPQLRFLQNNTHNPNHFLHLRLVGTVSNRDAIGARVAVTLADGTRLIRTVRAGDGFLAQSTKSLHFGLGDADEIRSLKIRWPGGQWEAFSNVHADRFYRLIQDTGKATEFQPNRQDLVESEESIEYSRPTKVTKNAPSSARVISASQLPIPTMSYRSFGDGLVHHIREPDGGERDEPTRPLLVNLWATYCRPCVAELTEWSGHSDEFREAGIDILALCVDGVGQQARVDDGTAEKLLEQAGFPFRSGWASEATVEKLHMLHDYLFDFRRELPIPTSFLIDSRGRVAAVYRGRVSHETVLEDVRRLPSSDEIQAAATPFPGRWHHRRKELNPLDFVWRLVESQFIDESIAYINEYESVLQKHFNFPKLLVLAGNGRLGRGEAAEAMALYRRSLGVDPDYSEAQNNLAWMLATQSDVALRNPVEALRLAKIATVTNTSPSAFDTLAAALAANGHFDEAVLAVTKGIEQADRSGNHQLKEQMRTRLRLYEKEQEYREW